MKIEKEKIVIKTIWYPMISMVNKKMKKSKGLMTTKTNVVQLELEAELCTRKTLRTNPRQTLFLTCCPSRRPKIRSIKMIWPSDLNLQMKIDLIS